MAGYLGSVSVPQDTQHRKYLKSIINNSNINNKKQEENSMSRAREIADLIGGPTPDIILKTADGAILNLQTSDTTVTDGSVLGAVNFTAPNEASGTDALLVGASIQAISEGTFAADNNATELVFMTGATATASARFIIASDGSLSTPTLGTNNVRFGATAGNSIVSGGTKNTLVGDGAGSTLSDADFNTHIGFNAGTSISTGAQNTIIGGVAGDALNTGADNVALGVSSLGADTKGNFSVAIGTSALTTQNFTTSTSVYNTAVGHAAGAGITTGTLNTILGGLAGDGLTTADECVIIGYNAGSLVMTGHDNTLVGANAGTDIAGGESNTYIGFSVGSNTTEGDQNTGMGRDALFTNVLGHRSVALGYSALVTSNPTTAANMDNVAVGYNAMAAMNTGIKNTAVGAFALDAALASDDNVAIGRLALTADRSGRRSVAVGSNALATQDFATSTISSNTAVGYDAGVAVTTGQNNTFIGATAGDSVTTAANNTFVGAFCGSTTQTGAQNTAMGVTALNAGTAGNGNCAFGSGALEACTDELNTAMGHDAGTNVTGGSNGLYLGQNAGITGSPGGNFTTGSNVVVIGNQSIGAAHIQVDWTVASDQRDKTDFTDLDLGLDFVKALAPVTYKWDKRSNYGDRTAADYDLLDQTPDGTHKEDWLDIGFKAQEVQALEEAAGYTTAAKKNLTVSTSDDGKQMGLQYSKFVPILVKAMQEQNALIEALTARITALEG